MVAIGVTGPKGVMAVLGVAGVICCAAGIAGDMMQDLKVGYILGGSPRKMEIAEIIGVVFTALVLAFAIMALHKVYTIGSDLLPAPQAGLMALMAQGIVGPDFQGFAETFCRPGVLGNFAVPNAHVEIRLVMAWVQLHDFLVSFDRAFMVRRAPAYLAFFIPILGSFVLRV